jgi:hypothetical protein
MGVSPLDETAGLLQGLPMGTPTGCSDWQKKLHQAKKI